MQSNCVKRIDPHHLIDLIELLSYLFIKKSGNKYSVVVTMVHELATLLPYSPQSGATNPTLYSPTTSSPLQ